MKHTQKTKLDLLKTVPLFSNLSKRHLKEIAKITDEVRLPAGNVIVEEGSVGYEFIFILEGVAKVEKDGQVVNRFSTNDFFGEMALMDKKPRSATVIAETDMELLVVGSRFFDHLLHITQGLQEEILLAVVKCNGAPGCAI